MGKIHYISYCVVVQILLMGLSESKKVQSQIEFDFKCLRKFYHPVYGEMTLLEDQETQGSFARVDKIIPLYDHNLKNYVEARIKTPSSSLIRVHKHYHYDIDMCSGTQQHVFILEFCTRTLYEEIAQRQENNQPFTNEELHTLFENIVQTVILLRTVNMKFSLSSHGLMFGSNFSIKGIEPFFCNIDVDKSEHSELLDSVYLSPEAYECVCRADYTRTKEISYCEASMIFTLGVMFIQCTLLAGMEEIYDFSVLGINKHKLNSVVEEVKNSVGDVLGDTIQRMVSEQVSIRPNLKEVKKILKEENNKIKKIMNKRVSMTIC